MSVAKEIADNMRVEELNYGTIRRIRKKRENRDKNFKLSQEAGKVRTKLESKLKSKEIDSETKDEIKKNIKKLNKNIRENDMYVDSKEFAKDIDESEKLLK